jgi:hypothetical protein
LPAGLKQVVRAQEAAMNQQQSDNCYFLIDAGHPRAVFRPPTDPKELLEWNARLKCGFAAIAASAAVVLLWTVGGPVRPLEATVQMERLTAKVAQTKFIHPDTVHALTRFVDQNGYDCDKVVCSPQLQSRNRAARDRLKTLIAEKAPSNDLAGLGKQGPLIIDAGLATTGAVAGTAPN